MEIAAVLDGKLRRRHSACAAYAHDTLATTVKTCIQAQKQHLLQSQAGPCCQPYELCHVRNTDNTTDILLCESIHLQLYTLPNA